MPSFDDAVRAYFGALPDATVSCETTVFNENSGCDTCGHGARYDTTITVTVIGSAYNKFLASESFDSLPDLWEALDAARKEDT